MKMVSVTIPIPDDDKPKELSGLTYGDPWAAEFTSIQLERGADPGADPRRLLWTVIGCSDRARPIRVQLVLWIVDEDEEILAKTQKMIILKNNTDDQEFKIEMKVKANRWSQAKKLRIRANYLIGT